MKHLTIKEAAAIIRALELSFTPLSDTGEFRVNLRKEHGGNEDTAYYTDCLRDAVDTAEAMAKWRTGTAQSESLGAALDVLYS